MVILIDFLIKSMTIKSERVLLFYIKMTTTRMQVVVMWLWSIEGGIPYLYLVTRVLVLPLTFSNMEAALWCLIREPPHPLSLYSWCLSCTVRIEYMVYQIYTYVCLCNIFDGQNSVLLSFFLLKTVKMLENRTTHTGKKCFDLANIWLQFIII